MLEEKGGWLRILEAFIAIMLIISALIILYSRAIEKPKKAEDIYKLQRIILDEIADSPELREAVLNNNTEKIISFVGNRTLMSFNFTIRVCELNDICRLQYYIGKEGKDIYSTERLISSTLEKYEPKKLKIFMWKE